MINKNQQGTTDGKRGNLDIVFRVHKFLKVTVYLQGCLARKRCSECILSSRYLNPYIKVKLIELAIKLYKEF